MQLYGENIFFISLAVILVPAFILGYCEKPLKHYGMAATVFFVVMTMKDKPQALLYMLCFVWYEYILAQIFLRITTGEHGSRVAYPAFLILSILPLTLHKILIAMNGNAGILAIIGISYMTFKAAQIIIEISDGIIKELKPDEYIYLMIFFPTLLSGPIDRSRRFEEDIRRTIPREEYLEMAGNGLLKILLGMVYKLAIASVFYLLMKNFEFEQIKNGNGFDHNWCLNTQGDDTQVAASIYSPETGILMEVFTDEPGIQVYSGNFLDGTAVGKKGITYNQHAAICLETQKYPDSPNKAGLEGWPNAYLNPGETYTSHCAYKFSVK